ncbi:hypothetical protein [Chitinophaga sp. 212800010-3]|uniref:hypothetical protein n=1 Tax=unclassified Chitinophaga TaxID=2619133 RepID=UPI002DE52228|nr:CelD-N domain-containing protein [Chitinophaga sp. 212800010-3]
MAAIRNVIFFLLAVISVPIISTAQLPQQEISKLLKPVNGSIVFLQRRYHTTDQISEQVLQPVLQADTGLWRLSIATSPVKDNKNALDITATFRLVKEQVSEATVAIGFNFSGWSEDNYLLVPASIYNGNRYRSIGDGYSPSYPREMYYNPAVPLTISNNPRLQREKNKSSLVELQTGNMATPAVCFFSKKTGKGVIVLTEQQTKWGNSGISIKEDAGKENLSFDISAPAVRKLAPGFGDFHVSGDKAPDWKQGDEVKIRLRIYVFNAGSIPDLLTAFMKVRKNVASPRELRNMLPMSQLLDWDRDICSRNFYSGSIGSYYRPENSNDFQLGWVSGMINTYPMLALNDAAERKRVMDELNFVVHKLQGKSGYFFGGIRTNGEIEGEKMHPDFPKVQAMVRKNGDALFWLMKHLLLLKDQGHGDQVSKEWEAAAQKLATAFAGTWQQHGEFGQYIAPETGEIAVFNSTAGAVVPAGLALAARYFNRPDWLKTAAEAAAFYYKRDVAGQGLTGGDCGDISQDANSESAFGLLESLMTLYSNTGEQKWLKMAETQAALCATWTLSYAPVFPPESTIGKLQCNMTGAVWASIQNKHAAPGICTSSGDGLFKLFRATGNALYADLIRDIQHAHAEAVNRPGHITNNHLTGATMERIQPSDAEGKAAVGNFIYTRNSWTETAGMLMALELPGIYIAKDKAIVYVFDHVQAEIVKKDKGALVLEIRNPTAYDASVTVMAENSREAAKPLQPGAFLRWQKVMVKAGEPIRISIKRSI